MSFPFTLGADTLGSSADQEEASVSVVVSPTGSWGGLRSVLVVARADAETRETMTPTACPNDFQALLLGPDGRLFCPWDGWRPS